MTKNQKIRIGKLGAEWTVLDSEENVINRLISEHHRAEQLRGDQARESKILLRRQRELFKRKREISDEILAIENGIAFTKKRSRGRPPDVYVAIRDNLIRTMADRTAREICSALDARLCRGGNVPPFGFPESWATNHHVNSFEQAYKKCRKLVDKLISSAKQAH